MVVRTNVMKNNSEGGLGFHSLPRHLPLSVPQNLLNVFQRTRNAFRGLAVAT